jgi:PAS domain S-box-containing protein
VHSEQDHADGALNAAEARLALATEAAQLGIWDWDLATNVFVYSPIARSICGLPHDGEISYEDVVRVTHPEDFPTTRAQSERALDPALRDTTPYEYRILRPSGEVRWVIAHGRAVFAERDGETRAVRYVGTLQDVTERKRLEDAERSLALRQRQVEADLAEREALLRSVFDAAELFIAVVELTNDSFIYVLFNKATADYYGLAPDRTDIDARELPLDAESIASWRASMHEIWQSGGSRTMEYQFGRVGEEPGWFLGTYAPLPAGPSGRARLSFVVIDITARKLADARQIMLMREVDHRAKNALAVAQAVVNLTSEDDPQRFKQKVQGRVSAIARAHSLLAADRWSGVDLARLFRDELAPYMSEEGARIALEGPPYLLAASQAQSMALMVHELATNAAKHGALAAEGGSIRVTWRLAEDDTLELLWQEQCAVDLAGAPARRGFGLNLIEHTVSHLPGGDWSLDWRTRGVVVTLRFGGVRAATPITTGSKEAPTRRRVLVVEDEALIALDLEANLEELGFQVVGSSVTTAEARRVLRAHAIDLAVLDVNLGGETTHDLAAELRGAGIAVLFCSGYEDVGASLELADIPRLLKPVSRDALAGAIDALLKREVTAGDEDL